jgi:hypothetical protein
MLDLTPCLFRASGKAVTTEALEALRGNVRLSVPETTIPTPRMVNRLENVEMSNA